MSHLTRKTLICVSASLLSHHAKQIYTAVTKSPHFSRLTPSGLISTTWRISSLFSSWGPSTPQLDPRWLWPASTSWFSSWVEWCTVSPTCLLCELPPAPWPTPWLRYPVSPWPCRSCLRSLRMPECKNMGWPFIIFPFCLSVLISKRRTAELYPGRSRTSVTVQYKACDYTGAVLLKISLL